MQTRFIILITLLFSVGTVFTQVKFPVKEITSLTLQALGNNNKPFPKNYELKTGNSIPGIGQMLKLTEDIRRIRLQDLSKRKSAKSDTMFVVKDQTITGTWTHTGPIVVGPGATLTFKHANATVFGNVILWGDDARLSADSSYLYFPQQYFYQRYIIAVKKSILSIKNSTLDYSDLSHNIVTMDNARIEMENVTNRGFTTNGIWGTSTVNINGSNQAGEYIITDRVSLEFSNAKTILLWHHFADTAVINFSFPKGDVVNSYVFNSKTAGVKGIGYDISVKNCRDVMWGMMPADGSDVTVSNSKIRSIGLWFLGNDSVNVSGLVDNSNYADFKAPVTDRNLHLINSSVQTWSLYPMQKTILSINGCILGEVGSGNSTRVTGTNIYVDGSGGYFWSADTSISVAGWSTATTHVRSQVNSIFIFGYSALTNGIASAVDNSVMIVVQSSLPKPPVALDGGCAWFANINQPDEAYIGDKAQITGSATIDKGPASMLMDFNYYRLYYQKAESSSWTQIGGDYNKEVRNGVLGEWDTKNLEPGQYIIKLSLTDNTPDKNTVDAVKAVNVLPEVLNTDAADSNSDALNIFPNPADDNTALTYRLKESSNVSIILFDLTGRKVLTLADEWQKKGNHSAVADLSSLQPGIYFLRLATSGTSRTKKIVKE